MELLGYIAAIFIGIALGLIGGGGSILTVPVLVYFLDVETVAATSYSLFIVGATSAVGAVQYFRLDQVHMRTAIVFGIPSIIAVFLTRAFIIPAIPSVVVTIESFVITKSAFLMSLFAILMLIAAFTMIKNEKKEVESNQSIQKFNYPLILLEGWVMGMLTGLVGAGGGFIIIPTLIVLCKLPMKKAVGTSLVIIAAKSLLGFMGESSETVHDWMIIGIVTGFAIVGTFIGMLLSKKIDGSKLKPAFGWFVLVMGIFILMKEIIFN
jgi:uncharacterized protein